MSPVTARADRVRSGWTSPRTERGGCARQRSRSRAGAGAAPRRIAFVSQGAAANPATSPPGCRAIAGDRSIGMSRSWHTAEAAPPRGEHDEDHVLPDARQPGLPSRGSPRGDVGRDSNSPGRGALRSLHPPPMALGVVAAQARGPRPAHARTRPSPAGEARLARDRVARDLDDGRGLVPAQPGADHRVELRPLHGVRHRLGLARPTRLAISMWPRSVDGASMSGIDLAVGREATRVAAAAAMEARGHGVAIG